MAGLWSASYSILIFFEWRFQSSWKIQEGKEFFFPEKLNSTFITLMPKTDWPNSFNDYIPIYLCNLVYKVIIKVLSNRMVSQKNNLDLF